VVEYIRISKLGYQYINGEWTNDKKVIEEYNKCLDGYVLYPN
jgi:hypothetical protein